MRTPGLICLLSSSVLLVPWVCHAGDPTSRFADPDLKQKKTNVDRTLPIRADVQPTFKNLSSPRSNPPVIGGPLNKSKNGAALNGTGMKQKR